MYNIINSQFSVSPFIVKHAALYPNPQYMFWDSVDTWLIHKNGKSYEISASKEHQNKHNCH